MMEFKITKQNRFGVIGAQEKFLLTNKPANPLSMHSLTMAFSVPF